MSAPARAARAPAVPAAALQVEAVSHYFGSLEVLRNVSFDVAPGEIVALLGASGCGKSTLLNLVAGLEPLQQGGIGLPPSASLGYMFQEDRLLPWRNVRDNVAFGLEASGLPRPGGASARWTPWRWWAWTALRRHGPMSSPAACVAAPRSRAPWSCSPTCY